MAAVLELLAFCEAGAGSLVGLTRWWLTPRRAFYMSFDLFDGLFQSFVIWWLIVFLLVAGFTYGKVPAKLLGGALILTGIYGFLPLVYLALNQPIP